MADAQPNDRVLKERLALNEAVERDINAAKAEPLNGSPDESFSIWCECSQPACGESITLRASEWDEARVDSHRFIISPGHDDPRLREVVERRDDFWIVEKQDEAVHEIVERTDPVKHPVNEELS